MKIIDLLNKIANGEDVPEKFKFDGFIYDKQSEKCYRCAKTLKIFEDNFILEDLNKEIEIIEENKKIEKLIDESIYCSDYEMILVVKKLNELIDKVNELEDK